MRKNQSFRFCISALLILAHLNATAQTGAPVDPPPSDSSSISGNFDDPNLLTVQSFDMMIPTTELSLKAGNTGAQRINIKSAPGDQIGEMLMDAKKQGLVTGLFQKNPKIEIYADKVTIELYREEIASQVIESFQKAYPNVVPFIRFRDHDSDLTYDLLYKKMSDQIDQQTAKTTDPQLRNEFAEQRLILKDAFEQTKDKLHFTAKSSARLKKRVAFGRAVVIGGIRAASVLPAFTMGLGPATMAVTLTVADAGVELFTAMWSQKMQLFLSKNPFALQERTFFEGKRYAIKSASINAATSIVLNTFWNTLFFVVIRATLMQSFAHSSVPDLMAWPLASQLLTTTLLNTPFAFLNGLFVSGYKQLVNKDRISSAQLDVALQGMPLIDMPNNLSNTDPKRLGWIRWITLPSLFVLFVSVGAAGAILPRRANTIVMVHETAKNQATIEAEQSNVKLEDMLEINLENRSESWQRVMKEIEAARALRGCNDNLDKTLQPQSA